jgi:formamidopyrimidine-DNA glycosylase
VAERLAVGRRIARVTCADDPIVFADEDGPRAVRETLPGRRVLAVHRLGKHLWFELDAAPHPLFHFGMTGAFRTPGDDPIDLEGGPAEPDRSWPPRFWKILLEVDGGGVLAMTNARRLGRIRLRDAPLDEPPLSRLGFDPLVSPLRLPAFRQVVGRRRRARLKSLLLDQSFAAGIGNWMADEILYQAALDPRRRAGDLTDGEVAQLHRSLKKVVTTAVEADARKAQFPRTWLFHHRWKNRAQERVTARGEAIEHLTVGGRTTAWVPSRQS